MRYTEEMQETLDVDWFAIDRYGNVAHFASAGGRLPESICESREDNETLITFFRSLPVTNSDLFLNDRIIKEKGLLTKEAEERYLKDFIFMSQRGLYSFDKKALGQFLDTDFQLIAKPLNPLNFNSLPVNVQNLVSKTKIENDLNEVDALDVAKIL